MTTRHRIVSALLRLYPERWRSEYGAELAHLLMTRPLTSAVIADVTLNALRERLRSLEISTVFGLIAMVAVTSILVTNIIAPQPYGSGWTTLLEPSNITFPTIRISPLRSELYVLFLIACGCLLHLKSHATPSRAGVAAMKVCLLASVPVMAAGVLVLLGILQTTVLGPGETPASFREHGLAITFYAQHAQPPSRIGILLAPLSQLGVSWIWGTVGGSLGRWLSRHGLTLAPTPPTTTATPR